MARYTGPKNKIARRESVDLGLKTIGSHAHAALLRRLNIIPGQHGVRGRRKLSGYGVQLREKQKVKRMYGVFERQFRKIFEKARKFRGNTGDQLIQFLERRLDNVLYRMGVVPTRASGRQMITHGHVLLNGKKVSIPSFEVSADDVVTLTSKGANIPAVSRQLAEKDPQVVDWIKRQGPAGKIVRLPQRSDVKEDITEQYIIEYYSR